MELLTNSRMSCMKTCLRKAYYRYELGIGRDRDSQPLRMGQAVHVGLDVRGQGGSVDEAILKATTGYLLIPEWAEPEEWEVERQIVARLISGYYWRYENDEFQIVATEQAFELPLLNPETNSPTPNFRIAGVIDKIVELPDGRLAVLESKTTSDSLDSDSDYWPRLRLDQQISLYMLAARALGYDVQTVLYDVIRKPGIRPKLVKGVRETSEEFGDRLTEDIGTRPQFYFARREIARLEADLDEFRWELWQQQKLLRECQLRGHWFRNSSACTSPYPCEFQKICFTGIHLNQGDRPPEGFVKLVDVHPELERSNGTNGSTTSSR